MISPKLRVSALLTGLVLCVAATAGAQTSSRLYFSAGWAEALRDAGNQPASISDVGPHRALVPAAVFMGGVHVRPWIGIEGSVQLQGAQSFPWAFTYLFAENTEELATHRDTPVIGYARFSPGSTHRVRIEPVIGGGFTWHSAQSLTTADCGHFEFPRTCAPVNPPVQSDALTTREWLVAAGVDIPVQLSSRLSVAPTLRVVGISRRPYLTGYDHRGPTGTSGLMMTLGLSATWSSR